MPGTFIPGCRFSLILAMVLIIMAGAPCLAQDYPDPSYWHVERIPLADNAGSTSGKSVVIDQKGYLWIGTNNGVSKYDGYTFKNYTAIDSDSTTLNHSRTDHLFIDHQNVLWVGTRLGINRYLPDCDCFKRYTPTPETSDVVPNGPVNWITEGPDNRLWVVTQHGGLYLYHREKDSFERFLYRAEDPIDISTFALRVIMVDRDGWLWIGTGEPFTPTDTGNGLIRFNPDTGEAEHYLHDPLDKHSLVDNRIGTLLEDQQGRIWVGTCGNGVHLYNPQEDNFLRMSELDEPPAEIYSVQAQVGAWSSCPLVKILHEDQYGGIWAGTYNGGIQRFDPETGQVRLFTHDPNNQASLGCNQVWSFTEDHQGRFWVGHLEGGGLVKIDPFQKKFQTDFADKNVYGIYEVPSNPNILWVSIRDEGVFRVDRSNQSSQFFQKSNRPNEGPASNVIWSFLEDRDQNLWLATDEGLSRYNKKTQEFTHFAINTDDKTQDESVAILRIFEDHKGTLWLGSWAQGAFRFDKETGAYQQITLPSEQNSYSQSVYSIDEDAQNRLWLGTWMDGIFLYDRKSGQLTKYLEGIGVREIHKAKDGALWLGTGDDGLIKFSAERGIVEEQYTKKEGLSGDKVYAIAEDFEHNLWLNTNEGLSRFDPKTKTFRNFTKKDGLPTIGFNEFSQTQGFDGTIYFGTDKGLVYFNPKQIMGNPAPPKVQLADIKVFDKSYLKGEYSNEAQWLPELPKQVRLAHQQNELTFEYVGLHYTNPAQNQYRHRLIPYEKEWKDAGTKREARYTNLNPGSYRFEVIASNSDGLWATTPAAIDIRILPPWWQTWWAYTLYFLAIGLALYAIYRYQKRRWQLQANLQMEQEKSQRLAEMDEFKSRFYANVTHEFRTPLTVIKGLTSQIKENPRWKTTEQLNLIERNSDKLLELINQMLDLSKLEAGKLSPNYIQSDIIKYLAYLIESFHSLAFSNKVSISFHTDLQHLSMDFDPEKVHHILSNLLSNAVKFTPEYGKIKVTAKVLEHPDQRWLEVQVKDTGSGIPKDKLPFIFDRFYQVDSSSSRKAEGTGIGLALVKELLELMEGNIQMESIVDQGTTAIIQLPIRNNAPLDTRMPEVKKSAPQPVKTTNSFNQNETTPNQTETPLVLLVEDNQDVIYYLKSCLEGIYQIAIARNGKIGLEKAIETIPDVIVSDVMMPEMDGFELCQALKTNAITNHIPVILLTAKVTTEDKMEGLTHGADAYLTKPLQKEELLLRLNNLVEHQKRMQQRYQAEPNGSPQEAEDPFLAKFRQIVEEHLEDPNFNVAQLSRAMGLSRVQIHRKLKALLDISITQFIRNIRLNEARRLLKETELTVSEIAYQVGFKDASHFSRVFNEHFGERPSVTRK